MAREERLILIIDEKGARVVERRIGKVGKTAKKSSRDLKFLKLALTAAFALVIIKKVGRLADSFTLLQNRIRLVTNSTEELNAVTNELIEVANRTRTPIASNANLFNRLAQAGKELGLTFQDVLEITESVNKAVIISGSTTQEATGAVRQLTQGISANLLQNQELNSILEQTSRIADVLAKRLGVTRGALKQLSEQGKITAKVIIEGFRDAKEELDEEFGRTLPTIGQSFTVLENIITEFTGTLDKTLKASAQFAGILLKIAGAIKDINDAIRGQEEITPQVQLSRTKERLALLDRIRNSERRPPSGPAEIAEMRGQALPEIPFEPSQAILDRALARNQENDTLNKGQVAVRDFNAALDAEIAVSKLGTEERIVAQAELKATNVLRKRGADLSAEETKATIARAGAAAKDNIELEKRQAILDDIKGPEKERLDTLRILSTLRAENVINEREFADAVARTNRELEVQLGLVPNVLKVFQDLDVTIEKLGQDIGNILVDSIDSAADALADFAISGFQNTEDLKAAFSDLFASLAKDILKAIIKLLLLQALQFATGTGGAGGGAAASTGGAGGGAALGGFVGAGLQAGGPTGRGQPVLVGERGPEIFTPTASGNITPNNQIQPAEVKVTVVNVTDPDEIPAAMGSPEGEQVVLNILQRNSETVRRLAT